jgi:hypothetical protein
MTSRRRSRANSNRRNRRLQPTVEQTSPGLDAELISFILHSKKWWLTPTVIVLLLLGLITLVSGTGGAAPFIYALH